MTKRSIRWV